MWSHPNKSGSGSVHLLISTKLLGNLLSIAKTYQKKEKDIPRKDAVQIFLLKHDAKKQNYKIKRKCFLIMKYNHSKVMKNKVGKM